MKKVALVFILFGWLGSVLAARPPKLTLLAPQDGASWKLGSRQTISWSVVPEIEATMYITLWGYNSARQVIPFGVLGEMPCKAGRFVWQVGNCPSRKVNPGDYFIRIWFFQGGEKIIAGNASPFHITSNWIIMN